MRIRGRRRSGAGTAGATVGRMTARTAGPAADEDVVAQAADESRFVFNVVWTGDVFDHLQYFVKSQMAQSGVRYRFIANACPPDQVAAMETFAEEHEGRVVEIV